MPTEEQLKIAEEMNRQVELALHDMAWDVWFNAKIYGTSVVIGEQGRVVHLTADEMEQRLLKLGPKPARFAI